MTHRTFDIATRALRGEDLTISLKTMDGEESPSWPIDVDNIPGSLIVGVTNGTELWAVFRAALGDEYTAFRQWVDDPAHRVDAAVFGDIYEWMVEQRVATPTRQPASS